MKMKTPGKILITLIAAGGLIGGYNFAKSKGYIKTAGIFGALVPEKAVLPDFKDAAPTTTVAEAPAPSSSVADIPSTQIRFAVWEWNAQLGLFYANGGAQTTKNSFMAKRNVNLAIYRQDDTVKMQEDLIACATQIHDGAKQCSNGANAVIIMGDGAGQFAAAVNPQLKKIGDRLVVIGAVGFSRGEDAFMAPPQVKSNPQSFKELSQGQDAKGEPVKGILISGVLRDGDWNLALKWAGDNGIKNNPDEKTFDPEALNWISSTDYNTAAADYVAGKCETRMEVTNGRPTGRTVNVCVNATVTWTPGDVTVVKKKGGLVKVADSKLYRSQMPSVIIGSKAFFDANREQVANLLAAVWEGSEQVRSYDSALQRAADISARIYNDSSMDWAKLYKGYIETDAQGNKVMVGGSAVIGMADNLQLFGLQPGSNDNFRATYSTFARIATQQYPDLFKNTPIPEAKDVTDKSFITMAQAVAVQDGSTVAAAEPAPNYEANANAPVVAERNYNINFEVGKATLTPEGVRQMTEIKDGIAITGLFVRVDGYTDNTGDEQRTNKPLSQARAEAVKNFLQSRAANDFPDSRFAIRGHGSLDPVASNSTAAGRAANRRVRITLSGK